MSGFSSLFYSERRKEYIAWSPIECLYQRDSGYIVAITMEYYNIV